MFTKIFKKAFSLILILTFGFGLVYFVNYKSLQVEAGSVNYLDGEVSINTQFSTNGANFSNTLIASDTQDIYIRQYYDNTSSSNIPNTSLTSSIPTGYNLVPNSTKNYITDRTSGNTNEVLEIDSNTTNNSTTFTDTSSGGTNHTITANGNVQHTTTDPILGSSVIDFDGSGDYLSIPDSEDFNFGSGDFTIETWINPASFNDDYILGQGGGGSASTPSDTSWHIAYTSNGFRFSSYPGGTPTGGITRYFNYALSTNTWYHMAFVRSGNSISLFVNGQQVGSPQSMTETMFNSSRDLIVGTTSYTTYSTQFDYHGKMQGVRLVKNQALYTSNFTPGYPGVALNDSVWSGQNLTVSPSSGIDGNANTDTSGNLLANTSGFIEYQITPNSPTTGSKTFNTTLASSGNFSVIDNEFFNVSTNTTCGDIINGQTCLSLDIIAGDLSIASPETETLSGVTLSSNDVDSTATISGINITDTRGSKTGWTASVSFQNLVSVNNPDTNNNILMANSLDNIISSNSSYLSINNTNHSAAANSSSLDGINRPLSPSFNTLTSLDNNGATGAITILSAPINQGAGSYSLDMNLTLTLPAFGTYGDSIELREKRIDGGDYRGNVLFTVI
jgi:hypothetical protein